MRTYAELRLEQQEGGAPTDEKWKEKSSIATTGMEAVVMSLALCEKVRVSFPPW